MNLKLFIFYSLLVILSNSVIANISEINFIDEEYIEIISNGSINFSNYLVFDENGKNNTISLVQNNNASMTIIAGSSFYQAYSNLSSSCNYYQTSGSQLSNGGLKSSGESLSLSSNTSNFSWNKTEDLFFNQGESLHFSNSSSFISNKSICSKSSLAIDLVNTTNPNNQTNQNNQNNISNSTTNQSLCGNSLIINLKKREITQKIEFDFDVNYEENISIKYWVENYEQEVLKNPLTTRNTNIKSYTPTKTSPIIIKAELSQNNCTYVNESETFFYKFEEEPDEIEAEELEKNQEKESQLLITSREIINNYMKLSIELYRGDTAKRVLNIFVNSKKQSSIEIPTKYSKVKTTLMIPLEQGENSIVLQGIELDQELNHVFDEELHEQQVLDELDKITFPDLKFFNISIDKKTIRRPFFSSGKILISCTVYRNKTKISNTFDLEIESGFHIIENILDETKLIQNITELKQTCKFKKGHRTTFQYETSYFNVTKTPVLSQNLTGNFTHKNNTKKENESFHKVSSNTQVKSNASIPIFSAFSLLIVVMIVFW